MGGIKDLERKIKALKKELLPEVQGILDDIKDGGAAVLEQVLLKLLSQKKYRDIAIQIIQRFG